MQAEEWEDVEVAETTGPDDVDDGWWRERILGLHALAAKEAPALEA